jgi:hypothetical protein
MPAIVWNYALEKDAMHAGMTHKIELRALNDCRVTRMHSEPIEFQPESDTIGCTE